jgi:beta-glucosidase-like glycosyl hydrolase
MVPFAPPIGRLRLPPLWTTDALHGAFSSPHYSNCTVFPQAISNAASFDKRYLAKMARVAADETRAKTNGEYGVFKSQT